ncbi:DNA polymerase zeta catalytic subunit [Athalia rosae]|uniref:DNA polymerase zeta catalytic subunit n=1 Tax=Athalia rosae TaxID=37344 RepID=UPI0020344EFF|nr:DNA polymerase zeta catalytic subunit [Athalia rosae]XP_048505890.1 DNA polymerase zeta catalytic subunit [Athalia rosae]
MVTPNPSEQTFAVRLVCAEYYQTAPVPSLDPVYSVFRGSEVKHVPVIRIFGSTLNGAKTCMHVHGVFPYLYVPYTGREDTDKLGYRLAASLDAAINVSLGSANARNQHVFKIQLISGMPLYGYHPKEHQFYKVYFYNPTMVKRAANLLQNGAVFNESLQPYEAHIPYIQQFMIDYNLHGMSMVDMRQVKHRLPPEVESANESPNDSNSLDRLSNGLTRQSTCTLEVDGLAVDILNRQAVEGELVLNPGLLAIWEEEKARRQQLELSGGDSQLVQPKSPTRPPFRATDNDIYQRQRLLQRLSTISQNDDSAISSATGKTQSSYPLEIDDASHLLNASHLEHHIGLEKVIQNAVSIQHSNILGLDLNLESSSPGSPIHSYSQSLDCSVLNAEDLPLLKMLDGLAEENQCESTVDDDSVLGSQPVTSKNPRTCDDSDDDKDAESDDMNLTLLQLDSLSWPPLNKSPQSSGNPSQNDKADREIACNYLSDLSIFDMDTDSSLDESSEKTIPQCDGAGDLSSDDSDPELDVTVERYERRICDLRSRGRQNHGRIVNVSDESSQENIRNVHRTPEKSKNIKSPLSSPRSVRKTPRRSNSQYLNSPGRRSLRSYPPLGIFTTSPSKKMPTIEEAMLPQPSFHEAQVESPHEMPAEINETNNIQRSSRYETDEEDTCNVTFTQYLETQLKENSKLLSHNKHEDKDKLSNNRLTGTGRNVVIVPRYNPPNFHKVAESMQDYGIPLCRNQNAFFSNHADTTNCKEVAHNLLKVPSNRVIDLPRFEPSLESVTGIKLWRTMKVKEVYPAGTNMPKTKMKQHLSGRNKIVIIPLIAAPLPKAVATWSKTRKYLEKRMNVDKSKDKTNSDANEQATDRQNPELNVNECTEHSQLQTGTSSCETDSGLSINLNMVGLHNDIPRSRLLGISCGQIEASSQADNFKIPCENLQDIKPLTLYQYLTLLCIEVHVATRGDLLPDPQHDAVRAIFYAIHNDAPETTTRKTLDYGVLVCDPLFDNTKPSGHLRGSGSTCPVSYSKNETDLFDDFRSLVIKTDPDILLGWELETLSWGYLFQRAVVLGINLAPQVSRIPCTKQAWEIQTTELNILTEIKMPGRIVLDVWRIMRHEIALQSYTFENLMYHVMHQRLSCPSFATLNCWWEHRAPREHSMVVEHYITKVVGIIRLILQLDIIGKTTEFARLYGILFFEVFSRGSQFQVESVMLRLAKPSNYVPVSPSVQQRASMRAPESLPLILEPESVFYTDPLIVLDFQSLYPSIIIAHNYCYSTCLGRVEYIGQSVPYEFGAATLKVTKQTAEQLQDKLNYSPCGVAFVKQDVRCGVLPRMLTEYLETRLMVKKAMKDHSQTAHALQRALYSRQRGLKLLANVTFGYTHANFSGRMPCIEIGDSIVSKARETLERAMKVVESTKRWNARVVYGDTDSLFVLLPGRSRKQAFEIGEEIANAVTADNPKPMKLKLEKIMQPAILQTKKRYCGYMYESPNQEKPTFLAKGIETVRRDGCPAVSKILERTLRILFDTRDVSQVKNYVTRQLGKVLSGRASIQELTFAKEFRGLQGYKASACVPALELTRRLIQKDPRAIPRTSGRVPYLIVAGAPNQPLFQCVRSPRELIADRGLRPNGLYYVTRVIIPPLNRCLNLLGVDVNIWYEEMPHRQRMNWNLGGALRGEAQKSTISQYFGTVACAACGRDSNDGICIECNKLPNQTVAILFERIRQMERARHTFEAICHSCLGRAGSIKCESLDCPVLYRRVRSVDDEHQISHMRQIIDNGSILRS